MPDVSLERIYGETCASIRTTDDISFKLMGIVPLLSGATILTMFFKDPIGPEKTPVVVALSIFAALITLGLFRWELRNIQTCSWLKRRAEALEKVVLANVDAPTQPKPPRHIGKTEAEKWIYSITIFAWLSMPAVASVVAANGPLLEAYVISAVLIGVPTVASALDPVRIKPIARQPKPQ